MNQSSTYVYKELPKVVNDPFILTLDIADRVRKNDKIKGISEGEFPQHSMNKYIEHSIS